MKRKYFFLIFFLFFISCKKNKDDINMSLIHSYYFIDSKVNEDNLNNINNNDTVKLSFENNDTLKIFYFHYDSGQLLNKIDTGYLEYFVEDTKIFFTWFEDKLNGVIYEPAINTWNVQVLNPDTLIVNRVSNSGYFQGRFSYSTKKK